jgi:hypothetical protein
MVRLANTNPASVWQLVASSTDSSWTFWLAPGGMNCLLLLLGSVLFCSGWWRFRHRDLPAPL